MSTKVDGSNMGPMQRKRSSSANEASKPINVLQIKQTYVDNKFINSPNTSSIKFGRERCDSLPTRNRTSSDSSNHSFTLPSGLLIGGGNNARNISLAGGLRSHTYRHSNSPPINSTNFGCSESEESSISIDEPDDSCGFMPYRFNSRSSEGVIPEENTDDIGGSDCSTKYNDLSSQIDIATMAENYVNMAPVIAKSQQAMNTDHHKVNNVLSPEHHTPSRVDIEFAECTADHVAKILSPDEETQMERPTRAYSIGSRNEHNRLFKQHMGGVLSSGTAGGGGAGNVYTSDIEHPSGRVRAFSVGSKARIPRCDLQRGMLKPKLLLEYQQKELKDNNKHHCHSNSSSSYNISTDLGLLSGSPSISSSITTTNAYNLKQLVGTHRDKKSTSAPLLLLHKSHNSVDRMSDLMEIDFSIKQQQQQQQQQQKQIQKNSNSTNSRININTIIATTAPTPITLSSTTIIPIMPTITTTATTAALLNKTYNSKSVLPIITSTATSTATQQDMPSIAITTTSSTAPVAVPTTNSKYNLSSHNSIRKYNNKTTTTKQHLQPQQHVTATDNGYLEMKPVGIGQQNIKQQSPQQQQQHQLKRQRSESLHINQTPKMLTTITTNKQENEGYDVPPDIKSNKHQQHQQHQHQHLLMRNLNANVTPIKSTNTTITPTTTAAAQVATTTSNLTTMKSNITTTNINTVLANKSQQQQQQQKQQEEIELKSDNDNNHNNLEIISLNDENNIKQQQQQQNNKKLTGIIGSSTPERKYDLILDLEQENNKQQKQQQQQQDSQINKNLFNKINDDYANMERKFDAYMKLNENSNNNTTTTTIAPATLASSSETMLKLYDNEKHVLTHSLSHDEKQNKQQQQQINRKSYGSAATATATTTNINNTSGYEMLQIKNNDKMLNQRIFTNLSNTKDNNNQITLTTTATATAPAATTKSKPRSTTTSNNGTINAVSLSQPVTPTTTSTPTINTCAKITAPTPNTSRPSSLNLEPARVLHYSVLDFPSGSSGGDGGVGNQEVKPTAATVTTNAIEGNVSVVGETVVLPSCTSVHNVYAKIDFDHSDSSSSSSKNI